MGSGEKRGGVATGGPRTAPASRVLLFDRLFDFEPQQTEEAQPRRVLRRGAVVDSIRTELLRLLNSRCAASFDVVDGSVRTVLNYGLPDFLALNPTRERDRQRLVRAITDAIRAYEPRLRGPVVIATPHPERPGALSLTVEGTVMLDNLAEAVSFPLLVEARGGAIRPAAPSPDSSTDGTAR